PARLYHPETGRFTTRDPHPTPLNKYQAFAANPIEHTDPTGNLQLKLKYRARQENPDPEEGPAKQLNSRRPPAQVIRHRTTLHDPQASVQSLPSPPKKDRTAPIQVYGSTPQKSRLSAQVQSVPVSDEPLRLSMLLQTARSPEEEQLALGHKVLSNQAGSEPLINMRVDTRLPRSIQRVPEVRFTMRDPQFLNPWSTRTPYLDMPGELDRGGRNLERPGN
ncbi:RHS repeat-associated core domain-containing protein, partial [Streptomyces sp. NRRL F-2664]|uniref:RHS repeat-associated core domain-containing protein n=1 Tax=Streptomyces sp. NRRL F-2664 TaxID=1463842 RepID=UPI0018FE55BF